jgi:hypothetical protein
MEYSEANYILFAIVKRADKQLIFNILKQKNYFLIPFSLKNIFLNEKI